MAVFGGLHSTQYPDATHQSIRQSEARKPTVKSELAPSMSTIVQQPEDEYGLAYLDSLQKGVWVGGPMTLSNELYRLYYKHGRELKISLLSSGLQTAPCSHKQTRTRESCGSRHRLEKGVDPHATRAYEQKRALWKWRCKRAVFAGQTTPSAIETSDSAAAWKLRVDESREFLETLPGIIFAGESLRQSQRSTITRISSGCLRADAIAMPDRNLGPTSTCSDRNFRKSHAARRNGVMIAGSERGRSACEKQRYIDRERCCKAQCCQCPLCAPRIVCRCAG